MPLNLEPRNGDFTPYIKFNSKAGRWYTKNENGDEVEVTDMTAIFDLGNIKTGWILFNEGVAPESVWDNGVMAPQPSPKHKRGFAVNVYSPKNIGGLREFSSNSNSAIVAIKTLYDAYESSPESANGLVPVVKCERVEPIKSKFGTNFQPYLKIVQWVPRPEGLTVKSAPPIAPVKYNVPPPKDVAPWDERSAPLARAPMPTEEEDREEF